MNFILGLLNTKIVQRFADMLNPTATLQSGDLARVPVIFLKDKQASVNKIVSHNIAIAKNDWDSFETSWGFTRHPILKFRKAGASTWGDDKQKYSISSAFKAWKLFSEDQFAQLRANEEELNRIFIEIYSDK